MVALPYDIETNSTFRGARYARICFLDIAMGKRIMVLVCSDTGFGKTLEAKRALRLHNTPFYEFGVTQNETDLVNHLWKITSGIIRHKGRLIRVVIADDKDGLARRETSLNHLKCGFGQDHRCIVFPSDRAFRNAEYKDSSDAKERKRYKASIPPPEFDLQVLLIWLSNINYTDPNLIATLPVHFHAMVSKGLDPFWIPNDAENGGRDVFIYTHYLATEKNSLGGEGYTYEVARQAVEFYVRHVHRLIDIPPRRLSLIAKVIAENPNPRDRDDRLEGMLRDTDQRPKLILPQPWIPVLLWPSEPPKRREPIVPPDPIPTSETEPITAMPEPDPAPVVPPPPESDPTAPPTPEPEPIIPPVTPPSDSLAAIMDAGLPRDLDERKEAFFSAVQQIEALGAGLTVWEAVEFVRHAEQGVAKRLFSYMTTRAIIEASRYEIERRRGDGDGVTGTVAEVDRDDRNSDSLTMKIAEIKLKDTVDKINETLGLPKVPYARQDILWTRAAVFQALHEIENRESVESAMLQLKHRDVRFWRSVTSNPAMTLGQLLDTLEK